MPWTPGSYPPSMKNLDAQVREKAVEIANALLEENYQEGRAIAIAIAAAKKWAENSADRKTSGERLHVIPHPQGWAVRRANAERASFVFNTKTQAQNKAIQMARDENRTVVIHDEDEEFESQSASASSVLS